MRARGARRRWPQALPPALQAVLLGDAALAADAWSGSASSSRRRRRGAAPPTTRRTGRAPGRVSWRRARRARGRRRGAAAAVSVFLTDRTGGVTRLLGVEAFNPGLRFGARRLAEVEEPGPMPSARRRRGTNSRAAAARWVAAPPGGRETKADRHMPRKRYEIAARRRAERGWRRRSLKNSNSLQHWHAPRPGESEQRPQPRRRDRLQRRRQRRRHPARRPTGGPRAAPCPAARAAARCRGSECRRGPLAPLPRNCCRAPRRRAPAGNRALPW